MTHLLENAGVAIELPPAWEGQIRRVGPVSSAPGSDTGTRARAADVEPVVLHAASFALPPERGDYGSGAVERMGPPDILLCLLEHDPAEVGEALFSRVGVPTVRMQDFSPSQMQRTIVGMAGAQYFFQAEGRTFCLYAVLGSFRTRGPLARTANEVVRTLRITGR